MEVLLYEHVTCMLQAVTIYILRLNFITQHIHKLYSTLGLVRH